MFASRVCTVPLQGDSGTARSRPGSDGAGILDAPTVEMALQNHLGRIELAELMKTIIPKLSNDVPASPVPQSCGLGFQLTLADVPGMRSALCLNRRLGRPIQFLLLVRLLEGHRWRAHDPAAALL